MENWRKYLKEADSQFVNEIEFYNQQPDYDKIPGGGKSVAVFDMETDYKKEGETHGGVSHSIKHYMEFDSSGAQQAIRQAASIVSGFDKVFIKKHGRPDVVAQGEQAKQLVDQNSGIMLNTFDMINDKMLNKISLNDSEQKLLPIIKDIFSKYKQLAENQLSDASDIDKLSDVNQILKLLNAGNTVRFTAKYGESEKIYALNPKNTAIVSYMGGKVSTFFKIDKQGKNKQKIVRYFTKGMEIKNPIVLKAFQQWAGAGTASTPQQQKKKKKPPQQKKGPPTRVEIPNEIKPLGNILRGAMKSVAAIYPNLKRMKDNERVLQKIANEVLRKKLGLDDKQIAAILKTL
jgi:hypothetical protein